MKPFGIWFIVILGVVYLEQGYLVEGDTLTSMEAEDIAKPLRPKIFSNADEFRNYLDQMSKYYALAGRSRYGKRALSKDVNTARSFSNSKPSSSIDLYDLIQQDM